MPRSSASRFVCNNCGQEYAKWQGKCFNCGQWETIVEFKVPARLSATGRLHSAAAAPVTLSSCAPGRVARLRTGFSEIDRVCGGGLVAGGVALLGGDPGIGKSTILLQICANLATAGGTVMYVSGEESAEQVALRAERLGISQAPIQLLTETEVEPAIVSIAAAKPAAVVIDSIQTVYSGKMESAPGSVSQVRECAAMLLRLAKQNGCAMFLVGHVTKEGAIAGPRILEHMVDTVLYFEGDSNFQYRILRSVKNRFGPSGEIALFSMHDRGLREVRDCAEFFMLNRENPQIGSVFVPVREGSRIIVVELQALVNRTHFGLPQRVAAGINPKKLALSLAVLERYGGIGLGDYDIFLNVAGGLEIHEPAADLGIAAAVLSSFRNRPIGRGMAFAGEVGLGGEVRAVNGMAARLRELAGLGFNRCVVPPPADNADWRKSEPRIELIALGHIQNLGEII